MSKKQETVKGAGKSKNKKINIGISEADSKYFVDKIDWEIINLLINKGRMSNVDLADKLNTSEATIRRRIDNLVQCGVVRGFAVLLDYKRLGSTCKATLQLKVNSTSVDKIAHFLTKTKRSCGVYRVIGKYNLYTEIVFNNIQEFQDYVDLISEMDDIEDFEYHIVTHSYKSCPWTGI